MEDRESDRYTLLQSVELFIREVVFVAEKEHKLHMIAAYYDITGASTVDLGFDIGSSSQLPPFFVCYSI